MFFKYLFLKTKYSLKCNHMVHLNNQESRLGKIMKVLISEITILLSLTVFLNLVAESMPTTSEAVPLIGRTKKKYQLA